MQSKNIFVGGAGKVQCAHRIYQLLMKRCFVSYADVLCSLNGREKDYYNIHTYSGDRYYAPVKKAFPEVIKALRQVDLSCKTKSVWQNN
jgi:hypothetical protein